MPQYIQVGEEYLEFPDNMGDAEIKAVLDKQFGAPSPTVPEQPLQRETATQPVTTPTPSAYQQTITTGGPVAVPRDFIKAPPMKGDTYVGDTIEKAVKSWPSSYDRLIKSATNEALKYIMLGHGGYVKEELGSIADTAAAFADNFMQEVFGSDILKSDDPEVNKMREDIVMSTGTFINQISDDPKVAIDLMAENPAQTAAGLASMLMPSAAAGRVTKTIGDVGDVAKVRKLDTPPVKKVDEPLVIDGQQVRPKEQPTGLEVMPEDVNISIKERPIEKIGDELVGGDFLKASTDKGYVGGHIREGVLRISDARVKPEFRGQGEGMKLYQSLIKEAKRKGLKVESDQTLEKDAVNIYEALKRRGYKVEENIGGKFDDGGLWSKGNKGVFEVDLPEDVKPKDAFEGVSPDDIYEEPARAPFYASKGRKEAVKGFEEGTIESVGYKKLPSGKVVRDDLEWGLIDSGINDQAILDMKNMNPQTKSRSKKMIKITDDYLKGKTKTMPEIVIGESVMDRLKPIVKYQKKESKKIGAAVGKNKDRTVEIDDIIDGIYEDLSDARVNVTDDGLDYSASYLKPADRKSIETTLNALRNRPNTFKELHDTKRAIYGDVKYGKVQAGDEKISDRGEEILKSIASKINTKLRDVSEDYAKANDNFAKATEAINPFVETMGKKFDPDPKDYAKKDFIENLIGLKSRRILSNVQSGKDISMALDKMDSFAKEIDVNLDDDLMQLVRLNKELESLGGMKVHSAEEIGKRAVEKGIKESKLPVVGFAVDIAKEKIGKRKRKSPSEEKRETLSKIKELINRE